MRRFILAALTMLSAGTALAQSAPPPSPRPIIPPVFYPNCCPTRTQLMMRADPEVAVGTLLPRCAREAPPPMVADIEAPPPPAANPVNRTVLSGAIMHAGGVLSADVDRKIYNQVVGPHQ